MKTHVLFALALAMPAAAVAAVEESIPYVDANGASQAAKTCAIVASDTGSWNDGWYAVKNADVTVASRIEVSGTVNLVLCDGAELTAPKGIDVPKSATLVIWAQSTGDGAGRLTVSGPEERNAGIGSGDYEDAGTITVNGGILDVTGGERAAGIGGGNHGNVTKVTVNGGKVKARGSKWGAGIGGGNCGGGTVEITGGTVEAWGGEEGAGIGGGDEKAGGTVTISGGIVEAHGGERAAGIGGGGPDDDNNGGNGGTITISGGTVKAYGGTDETNGYGAGIGGGKYGDGGTITITGSAKVEAHGGYYAAGIGGGKDGSGGTVSVSGSAEVVAFGGSCAAGIGSGGAAANYIDKNNGGTVTIRGGTVNAKGGYSGAGIGGGAYCKGGEVTIGGGTVTAVGGFGSAGIGGGTRGGGGTLTVTGGDVTARGNTKDDGSYNTNTYAPAVGAGKDSAKPGTVTFGDVRVTTDTSATPTTFADADKREEPCRSNNTQVRIVECDEHEFSNHYCRYCGAKGAMPYADAKGEAQTPIPADEWTQIAGDTKAWNNGWYATGSGDGHVIEISSRVTVTGNAHLILGDGAELKIPKGITVNEGASLTIWTETVTGIHYAPGKLTIAGPGAQCAGIGGGGKEKKSGAITVNGGVLDVAGGEDAAGIGGGDHAAATAITINGGEVTAKGSRWSAGIGGGNCGSGGRVEINGGTVRATGGSDSTNGGGAGIGGGDEMPGGTVVINGGTVEAYGGDRAAGIGGGGDKDKSGRAGGTVTITGGTVTATGGRYGAGIGGGNYGDGGTVTIDGGTVTATAGAGTGRAIGRGDDGKDDGSLTLYDRAKVTAGTDANSATPAGVSTRASEAQANHYAKIETCEDHNYGDGFCTYCGAEKPAPTVASVSYVNAKGEAQPAKDCWIVTSQTTELASGWWAVTENVAVSTLLEIDGHVDLILCDGATLTATQGVYLPADDGISLTIWAQSTGDSAGSLTATGRGGAGIGGKIAVPYQSAGGTLTVNGGHVTATGDECGAGIGGDTAGHGGMVIVNGGSVIATGNNAPGIGGGMGSSDGGTVTVTGGYVKATGGGELNIAGIGSEKGSAGTVAITGGTVEVIANGINPLIFVPDLTIGGGIRVSAGQNQESAKPVTTASRVKELSQTLVNGYAKIEPCKDHNFVNGVCSYCGAELTDVTFTVAIPAKGAQIVSLPLVTPEGKRFKFCDTAFGEKLAQGCGVLFWDEGRQGWSGGVKGSQGWDASEANRVIESGQGFALVNSTDEAIAVTVAGVVPSAATLSRAFAGDNKWSLVAYPYPVARKFGDTALADQLPSGASVKFWNAAEQAWTEPMAKTSRGWGSNAAGHELKVGEAFFVKSPSGGSWEESKP